PALCQAVAPLKQWRFRFTHPLRTLDTTLIELWPQCWMGRGSSERREPPLTAIKNQPAEPGSLPAIDSSRARACLGLIEQDVEVQPGFLGANIGDAGHPRCCAR